MEFFKNIINNPFFYFGQSFWDTWKDSNLNFQDLISFIL
jgi:hypothetical protein